MDSADPRVMVRRSLKKKIFTALQNQNKEIKWSFTSTPGRFLAGSTNSETEAKHFWVFGFF